MGKYFLSTAGLCLLFTGLGFARLGTATAQNRPDPPKVLTIEREFLKPGKAGSPHQKSESVFVQAFSDAKWPEHYLALDSMSGRLQTMFLAGYDSFAAWQKASDAIAKNPTLAEVMDSTDVSDGELLDSYDTGTFVYDEDLSLRAPVRISDMRYMEFTIFNIRPGHCHDWNKLVKIYIQAWSKVPDAHWAMYEKWYGDTSSGGQYVVISPIKSLAEVDQERMDGKKMDVGLSADDKKKIAELSAATIESEATNLFAIDPKMSYVPDSWGKGSDFWGQK
ncbi:MAG: hypothetical protein WCE63_19530 [Acidobacteriaceae bacterium]